MNTPTCSCDLRHIADYPWCRAFSAGEPRLFVSHAIAAVGDVPGKSREAGLRLAAEEETLPERTKRDLTRIVADGKLTMDQLTGANLCRIVSVAKKYGSRCLATENG